MKSPWQIDPKIVEELKREKKTKQLSEYTAKMNAKPESGETFTKKSLFRVLNNVQVCVVRTALSTQRWSTGHDFSPACPRGG